MEKCLTYQQVKEKLNKVEKVLKALQAQNVPVVLQPKVQKLTLLKESYMNTLNQIKEQDTGTVFTDKPDEAEKLAKKGVNVKLTKEQEGAAVDINVSEQFTETVLKVLKDVLRDLGEEISKSGVSDHKATSFNVNIEFLSEHSKQYKFEIKDGGLYLDATFICDVNILPSGDVELIGDVLRKGLVDYFKQDLDFQEPDAEDQPATDSQGNMLEVGDKIKVKDFIFEIGLDSEKNIVYLETKGKRVYGGSKKFQVLLENAEKVVNDFDDSWIDDVLGKQAEDWEEKQAGKHSKMQDDEEEGIVAEKLQGPMEIVVQMDGARKATQVYKDGAYQSRYGIRQTYLDTFAPSAVSLQNDLEGMELLLADFEKHGIAIKSENVTDVTSLHESKEVEIGDRVKISKEYGGARGKVKDKRGSWIVLDNGESYHESDVVSVRRDFNEDFHIGHIDDEPGMLAQTAFEIANYAADIHKMLKFYESMEHNVNFPNWWQSKVILARDYISKAAHWLEYETRELDQTQSYLQERRKCKYSK